MDTEWKTVQMKKNKVGFNQECPESHSFAFDWVNLKLQIGNLNLNLKIFECLIHS